MTPIEHKQVLDALKTLYREANETDTAVYALLDAEDAIAIMEKYMPADRQLETTSAPAHSAQG